MSQRFVRINLFNTSASFLGLLLLCFAPKVSAREMPIAMSDPPSKSVGPNVKGPSFDVASIKENKSSAGMMSITNTPDGFESVNISLRTLIANAYGIKQDLIFGAPNWADSKGFDINAKVAGSDVELFRKLSPRQRPSMLQALLVERFHLSVHTETKILPTYDLIIAKGGSKMKEAVPDLPPTEGEENEEYQKRGGSMTMGPGEFTGHDLPMASVTGQLSYMVHRTVNDKTGLIGKYDLTLKYASEDGSKKDDGTTEAPPPSIFTAVQEQLGLKLISTKGPVETLVIDHAEIPSEN
jgi:uncharacterized protein (TIGR03435 family)